MTKVEELRAVVMHHSTAMNPREEVDALVSVVDAEAFARGRAEGAEKAEEEKAANWAVVHKAFPNLPRGTEIDRLREKMFAGHTSSANVDALCAEVAEQERERIRKTARMGIGVVDGIDHVLVPVSILAPTYTERLRDSVTDEINGEDVDPTPD